MLHKAKRLTIIRALIFILLLGGCSSPSKTKKYTEMDAAEKMAKEWDEKNKCDKEIYDCDD